MHTREEILQAVGRLLDVQERLRKECPWDRKQTYESLRPNTIEETYELSDALLNHDEKNISKELGDVMEHVMFYSILGKETDSFDLADVCNQQADKLMFRHNFIDWRGWKVENPKMKVNPESGAVVYRGDEEHHDAETPTTAREVELSWEQMKERERDGNKRVLSGVPAALPSMIKAERIQEKARNVGFDWKQKEDVWAKVREELGELEAELRGDDKERQLNELGDYIFSIINAARLYHLNPDTALEHTNRKFISRFNYIEDHARAAGKHVSDLSLEEMDALWNEAKQNK